MNAKILALKRCMEKLVQHHAYLLNLADRKTKAIQRSDRLAIEAIMRFENGEVRTLRQMEKERTRIVSALLEHLTPHLDVHAPMTQWLSYLPEKERCDIEAQRVKLQAVIKDLQNKNDLNQQLLNDGLAIVSVTLDGIRLENYTMYTATANRKQSSGYERFSAFDSKV